MALKIYQSGIQPLGQFDVLDSYLTLVKGGEVGTLFSASRTVTADEKAVYDVLDGYTNVTDQYRVAVAPRVNASTDRPIFLLDDGITGYGTLFGTLIGSPGGLCTGRGTGASCATSLGPHTSSGSGKVTCWDKPGVYAVSVDAVDTSASGLVLTNASCDPGVAIKPLGTGVLTQNGSGVVNVTVGRFMEFETSPFLVTTPPSLVGAAEAAVNVVFHYEVEG